MKITQTTTPSTKPVPPKDKLGEEPSPIEELPSSGLLRWAKIGLVALAVIAVVGMAYYFYQTRVTEEVVRKIFSKTGEDSPLRDVVAETTRCTRAMGWDGLTRSCTTQVKLESSTIFQEYEVKEVADQTTAEWTKASVFCEDKLPLWGTAPHKACPLPPVDPVRKRHGVLYPVHFEFLRGEDLQCCSWINARPNQVECQEVRRENKDLKTEQGKTANAWVIGEVEKHCSENACQRLADFPDKPMDDSVIIQHLVNKAWLNTPYKHTPEGVKGLLEERYVKTQTKKQGHIFDKSKVVKQAQEEYEACSKRACSEEDEDRWIYAPGNCEKVKCPLESAAYYGATHGYATYLTEKVQALISSLVQTLCPGPTCTLSDQKVFDAMDQAAYGNQ